MAKPKKFSELTVQGQKKRIAKHEQERAAKGTTEVLCRLVKPAEIKNISNSEDKLAVFRLAIYQKESDTTIFKDMNAYLQKGKTALEAFYRGLVKGQLVAVEYKENGKYNNVYNMIDRSYADSSKRGNKGATGPSAKQQNVNVEADLVI